MGGGQEVIREVWRRWNAGDRDYDPEWIDPQVEVHSVLAGRVFRGEAELSQWIAEIEEQFDAWELTIAEIEEVDPDRFLVRGGVRARGRQSGVDLDQPLTWLVTLRDGRMTRLKGFWGSDAYDEARVEAGA
jgi:ketosteroid isomerase-like protein